VLFVVAFGDVVVHGEKHLFGKGYVLVILIFYIQGFNTLSDEISYTVKGRVLMALAAAVTMVMARCYSVCYNVRGPSIKYNKGSDSHHESGALHVQLVQNRKSILRACEGMPFLVCSTCAHKKGVTAIASGQLLGTSRTIDILQSTYVSVRKGSRKAGILQNPFRG
jgi:hypothetical protein